jgi:hypothetical protein
MDETMGAALGRIEAQLGRIEVKLAQLLNILGRLRLPPEAVNGVKLSPIVTATGQAIVRGAPK